MISLHVYFHVFSKPFQCPKHTEYKSNKKEIEFGEKLHSLLMIFYTSEHDNSRVLYLVNVVV